MLVVAKIKLSTLIEGRWRRRRSVCVIVVIAAALMHEPQVLVVDEPMVGLDPKSARVVKDILHGLSRNGAAVFMSTHTLAVAEELADHIGIIHRARLVAHGTLEELRRVSGSARGLEESFLRLTAEEKG